MKIPFENIIYLDPDFVYSHYEHLKGKKAVFSLSKTEGGDAGLKVPVLSAGISTRTTKQYQVSPESVLNKIFKTLKSEPPKTLEWIDGDLSIGLWKHTKEKTVTIFQAKVTTSSEKELLRSEEVLEIYQGNEKPITLLYDSHKFYPGYANILNAPEISKGYISFPVDVLGRRVVESEHRDFFIPYLMTYRK